MRKILLVLAIVFGVMLNACGTSTATEIPATETAAVTEAPAETEAPATEAPVATEAAVTEAPATEALAKCDGQGITNMLSAKVEAFNGKETGKEGYTFIIAAENEGINTIVVSFGKESPIQGELVYSENKPSKSEADILCAATWLADRYSAELIVLGQP